MTTAGKQPQTNPYLPLHAAYLFCMLGGLIPMLINGPSDFRDFVSDRSQLTNVIYLGIHALYAPLILTNLRSVQHSASRLILPTILTLYVTASVFWSLDPIRSIVIGVFLLLQLITLYYIFSTTRYEDFVRAFSWACFAAAALSFVLIFGVPSYGRMTHVFPGAWQGIFIHKNVLGRFAIFSTGLFMALCRTRSSAFNLAGLAMSVALAIGTGSATAILGLVGCALIFVALWNRRLLVPTAAVGSGVLLFYFLATPLLRQIPELFGKSQTLSGRTTIWAAAIEAIMDRPLLGYGMGAFWGSDYASRIRGLAGWFVPHAHNGFLEIGLQIGIIGMILMTAVILKGAAAAFRSAQAGGRISDWPLYVVFFAVLYGAGEANFLRPNSFVQVALFAVLAYATRQARQPARSGRLGLPPRSLPAR